MKNTAAVSNKTMLAIALLMCALLSACVGTVVGAAVDTTIEVAKLPFKAVGAVVDLAIPDDDEDN